MKDTEEGGMRGRTLVGALVSTLLVAALAHATSVLRFSVDDLADRADVIVLGTCVSSTGRLASDGVVTDHVLTIDRVLKGQVATPTFSFTTYGGVTPERGTFVAGTPTFARGEVSLVFLDAPNQAGYRMVIGLAQGKFTVREVDGRRLAFRNLEGLRLVDPATGKEEEAGAEQGMPLDDLLGLVTRRLKTSNERSPR
jgi:hypothetical protein